MDKINKIAKKSDVHLNNLPQLSGNISQQIKKIDDHFEISVYNDNFTIENVIQCSAKVKKAFPQLTEEFFDIFANRIKEHGFSDQRLKDAVNNVIDNCIYPQPTIAQFISFDQKIKVYNYDQIIQMINENRASFKNYPKIRVPNVSKPMYVHQTDFEKYKLTKWE